MSCKAIMVVEDDEDIRTQVIHALNSEGYEVLSAENGRRALDLLLAMAPEKLPGCIILDLMMPEMDGKTFLDTIARDHPSLQSIKILVATAKGSPVNPAQVPQAVERLQKPFELEALYRAVEKHCGQP
ncbi:MAG: response regulator [Proteobacteria bacterium]|nr:MAG: response regulator [Pseudomonadota bacterium]